MITLALFQNTRNKIRAEDRFLIDMPF